MTGSQVLAALLTISCAAFAGCATAPYIAVDPSRARAGEIVQLTLKTASFSGQYWGYFVPECGGVDLERKNGSAWIRVDQGPWPPCNDIAYGYGRGSKTKVDYPLPVDLLPGQYRVTTGLSTDTSPQLEAVSSPFEVEMAAPQKPPPRPARR